MEPIASSAQAHVPYEPSLPAAPGQALHTDAAPYRRGLSVLGCAAGSGVLVSAFALYQAPGLGVALAALTVVVSWILLARLRDRTVNPSERMALAIIAVVGALPAFRTSSWLVAYDTALLVGSVALLPILARGGIGGFGDLIRQLFGSAGAIAAGAARGANDDLPLEQMRAGLRAPLIGFAIALPFAALFLILFASADAVFASLLERLLNGEEGGLLLEHALVALAVAWALAGLAWHSSRSRDVEEPQARQSPRVRAQDLSWGLSLLVALFSVFVVVQAVQIAGFANALAAPGVTYAAAAREGFFQLLTVTALVCVLVPTADWLALGAERAGLRLVRGLLTTLLALCALVAMSALWRMARYTDAYGLTELRFHASALMLWLLVVLGWMQRSVLCGRRGRFLAGAALSLVAGVVGLHVVNPDGVIASNNLHRASELDVVYLQALSNDATPVLAAAASSLSGPHRENVCDIVESSAATARYRLYDWPILSWSLARQRAAGARCSP